MRAADQGPIPTKPLSQQDTQPMETDDFEIRRRDKEAAEKELEQLQASWRQKPSRPVEVVEEPVTVVVDREKLDEWLRNEEARR